MTTQQLDRVAGDRLTEILTADDPTEGLWVAHDDGFFGEAVPEISALAMEQDPVHRHKDVLTHTFMVTANTSPRLLVRLAALFHDVGKPRTRRFVGGKVTFHHHEAVGARMTTQRLAMLGYEPAITADVARLVELSGRFHGYQQGWEDSAVRRYARDAGPLLGDLNELVRCDCTTRRPEKVRGLQRRMDELEDRIRQLAADEALQGRASRAGRHRDHGDPGHRPRPRGRRGAGDAARARSPARRPRARRRGQAAARLVVHPLLNSGALGGANLRTPGRRRRRRLAPRRRLGRARCAPVPAGRRR